ncbi:nuclear transport factor 2 family protein [Mycetocola tolaasinivorans]|uniref:Nuclear transport factor 2 family protein n=1 Tax=Mycetocola tolaasinivorans TaxID=76635 RepID=A0A3L7A8U2_9MICO|nr:nuclear transport factor 2 family protein [Mycetocola tolaasinivorans]RLP76826.1 nuclear transport factor 2 family protein [Mycetocola tolaasinivorans]
MSIPAAYQRYEDALATGDMAGLAAALHPSAVWHQPGTNPLSGDHVGPDAILALLGGFMERSQGSFALRTESRMVNGDTVATAVSFSAQRPGRTDLTMGGIDIFRIADDRVAEIWLFSADQDAEDAFWQD